MYGTDALLACHDRAAIMRPTSGMDGAAMDTEYHYPGLHLDVDPQSYCCEDTGTADAVREFLNNLLYGDDKYVFFFEPICGNHFFNPTENCVFYLDFYFFRDFVAENNAKHWTMGRQVQGVINLIDNRLEDGGFQCVPTFDPSSWLRKWTPTQRWTTAPEPNGKYV